MILTAVIVEDEKASRETLSRYLEKYCPEVKLLAMAENVMEGKNIIDQHKPDIVFLDVEMPRGNAFDLLELFTHIDFATVFVTAFSNYAIKALNISASYYILKPVDIDELIKAVEKIKIEKEANTHSLQTKILLENIQAENKQQQKVVLPLLEGFEVVPLHDVVRCQADDNFTMFYLTDGSKTMVSRTLKFYEDMLTDYDFIRVHKSHLVNFNHIKRYLKGKGGQVQMNDGSTVDVSPTKKKHLLDKFKLK